MRTLVFATLVAIVLASGCAGSHRGGGGGTDAGIDAAGCAGVRCPGAGAGCRIVPDGTCCGREECTPPPDAGPTPGICCGFDCDPMFFPTFSRSCAVDADCFVALHQIDCCGTHAALGLSTTQRGAFESAEATCSSMYPGCGCPSGPTAADDGTTCLAAPSVHCEAGSCATTCTAKPPPDGCDEYCDAITAACMGADAQYGSIGECASVCAASGWRPGTPADTSGNSLACRRYHAGAAASDPAIHCPHAGASGGGVCTD